MVIIYLLGGAVPYEGDAQNIIFSSPAFILACAALVAVLVVLCGKKGLRLKTLFFQMLHFGVVFILAGAFIGHVSGIKSTFSIPVDATLMFDEIPYGDDYIGLGYDVSVADFEVERYPSGADKAYDANLVFSQNGASPVEKSLRMNHPVEYGKWKFYLLSYDSESQAYITVQAKHDSGVPVVLTGIWLTIIGAFGQCLGIGQPFRVHRPNAGIKKHEKETAT